MKKLCIVFILSVFALTGCAHVDEKAKPDASKEVVQTDKAKTETVKQEPKSSKDESEKQIMDEAAKEIRNVIAISSFKYAPKEFFDLLVTYLEMQNAYFKGNKKELKTLKNQFYSKVENTQAMTIAGKEEWLKNLQKEIDITKQQIEKQEGGETFTVYPTIYIVKKGDTLPSISARHEIYNDSYMWPLIYKANRDQIKDPKKLYGGQDLKIPRDMSTKDIIDARREAGAPDPEKIPKDSYSPKR
jgi:nucleoid-associated protein YgaU